MLLTDNTIGGRGTDISDRFAIMDYYKTMKEQCMEMGRECQKCRKEPICGKRFDEIDLNAVIEVLWIDGGLKESGNENASENGKEMFEKSARKETEDSDQQINKKAKKKAKTILMISLALFIGSLFICIADLLFKAICF